MRLKLNIEKSTIDSSKVLEKSIRLNNYGIIGNVKTGDRNGDYVMYILNGKITVKKFKIAICIDGHHGDQNIL